MQYRIKMIKFYQAVYVEGKQGAVTSFTPDELVTDAASRRGLRAEESDKGVFLYSDMGRTLVSWANVAYIQYLPVEVPKSAESAKPTKVK